MNNNDILIRLRYALDMSEPDMVKIFEIGGVTLTREDVQKRLIKSLEHSYDSDADLDDQSEESDNALCSNSELECFLNGFIIFKRGKQEPKEGQPAKPELVISGSANVNNILLKKLKVALSLTSDDMLTIFADADFMVTKGELGALFRHEGHKHYKECGDQLARNFLRGLTLKYRP